MEQIVISNMGKKDYLGDRPIGACSFADVASLRNKLMNRGLAVSSMKWSFSTIIRTWVAVKQKISCVREMAP